MMILNHYEIKQYFNREFTARTPMILEAIQNKYNSKETGLKENSLQYLL